MLLLLGIMEGVAEDTQKEDWIEVFVIRISLILAHQSLV